MVVIDKVFFEDFPKRLTWRIQTTCPANWRCQCCQGCVGMGACGRFRNLFASRGGLLRRGMIPGGPGVGLDPTQ